MTVLGLHYLIWVVLIAYFAGMLALGWYSKRQAASQEGYLMGNRRFGIGMMVMHAFGAGTHPGDVAGVVSKTVGGGASGIWVSWMWMFGTPFYWLIAPIIRRLRCLTLADYFRQRYNQTCTLVYVIVATVGMTLAVTSILLATTRTVQGMMGKAGPEHEAWFYGILICSTVVFAIYGYWGGIVAAIRTDMAQGLMIIALSFVAIPAAIKLQEVGGFAGVKEALVQEDAAFLSLFDPGSFKLGNVILLCIISPLSMMAQPHLITVCGAGKTEWEGRVGFTYGNILKRICTMGWCILGLCWLAYLFNSGQLEGRPSGAMADAAFGDAVRALLNPFLQGLMLACVMAAAMSTGDAMQVTVAGLISQNIYKVYFNPQADDKKIMQVTKITGLGIVLLSLLFALLLEGSFVRAILDFNKITGYVGISVVMGILWRRMNAGGMLTSVILAEATFVVLRYFMNDVDKMVVSGVPLAAGLIGGIVGSLLTRRPETNQSDTFFKKIHTPIGQEEKLSLPLDEAVPVQDRLVTAGGLFILKPSRQSWLGFLLALGICLLCLWSMFLLLR